MKAQRETHVELGYSVTASIDLRELMEEEGVDYTVEDIKSVFAKYHTLFLTMKDGTQVELDISLALMCIEPCIKYPSTIGVYECSRGGETVTLAESEEYAREAVMTGCEEVENG